MPVHYEPGDDHVVWITIDRLASMNSLDMDHFAQLRKALGPFRRGRRRLGGHHHRRGQRLLHRAPT